jgi:hypothetical protein
MKEAAGAHFSAGELEDYFASALPDDREKAIEEHLAVCDDCTRTAREVRVLEELWQWTAQEHGELYRREILEHAWEAAERDTRPDVLERLCRWRERGIEWAEAGLHIVLEGSRAAARGVDAFRRPQSKWRFDLMPQAIPVRGVSSAPTGSVLLSTEESGAAPAARVAVRAGDHPEVVVRVDRLAPLGTSPLVVLVDLSGGPPPVRTSRVEAVEGLDYGIARFDGLADGQYLLLFAPLDEFDSA